MNLSQAMYIAVSAHSSAVGEDGELYLLHPLRVMMDMDTDEERIVAVLHDIVEDTYVTMEQLKNTGFSDKILDAVEAITRKDQENYEEYIRRVSLNPLARKVKIADIEDNLNVRRLKRVGTRELDRIVKYCAARKILLKST